MFVSETPSLLTSFIAGILTFLSPCIFPLLPGYISFISGESLDTLKSNGYANGTSAKKKAFYGALFFGLGFSLIFVALGATATGFGKLLSQYQILLARIAGIIVIVFGLHLIGVFKIKLLLKQKKVSYKKHSFPFFIEAFVLGMAFVLGWTPCVGPILTGILALASQKSSVAHGMILLFTYSLGLWIPFLIAALAVNEAIGAVKKFGKHLVWIERAAGILLIFMGLILATNNMTVLVSFFSGIFSFMPVLN